VANSDAATMQALGGAMVAVLAGVLAMFFIERFFSYHHHDAPEVSASRHASNHQLHSHSGEHSHDLSWSGAALGLALHSVLNGVALAAAVGHGDDGSRLAGLGTFLVIFLHKPFDAMTIGMLMARGGWSLAWRHTVNALFALAIPAGALLFYFGLMSESHGPSGAQQLWVAYALAFSAGTFLCISLSDLLPELQFHQHDRVKLSVAMLLGLSVAWAAGSMESATHRAHTHPVNPPASSTQRAGFTNFA
jgi:zinc and cadmium transporter